MARDGHAEWTAEELLEYRGTDREQQRITDLLALLPASGSAVLDVGARDGYLARRLVGRFARVVALDLIEPRIDDARIECRQGDATALPFADATFDAVLCAEVLEHIPGDRLAAACRELARVARDAVVVGVPFRQELRYGRTTCSACGGINPPWGHVNAFDEQRLHGLFAPLAAARTSFVGSTNDATSALAVAMLDYAGNPYGTYAQDERCVHCNAAIGAAAPRSVLQKIATRFAHGAMQLQQRRARAHPRWIHIRFEKPRR